MYRRTLLEVDTNTILNRPFRDPFRAIRAVLTLAGEHRRYIRWYNDSDCWVQYSLCYDYRDKECFMLYAMDYTDAWRRSSKQLYGMVIYVEQVSSSYQEMDKNIVYDQKRIDSMFDFLYPYLEKFESLPALRPCGIMHLEKDLLEGSS